MWLNQQETADLVTFSEESLNEKHFLCSEHYYWVSVTPMNQFHNIGPEVSDVFRG